MKIIGSQRRESLQETDYIVVHWINKREVILRDPSGKDELWFRNDHSAGYVVEINGKGFEFCRTIRY